MRGRGHHTAAPQAAKLLDLSEDELAFYDAREVNDSAVKILGEPTLVAIAQELVESVRHTTSIDWTVRENVRAKLRVIVKRILRKHGYPPASRSKREIQGRAALEGEHVTKKRQCRHSHVTV